MMKMFITLLLYFLIVTPTCNASWLIYHEPSFKGKIVDIVTNDPIKGAVVVVIYRKLQIAIGDAVDRDIHVQETLTDAKGEFSIPTYTTLINPLSWSNTVDFYIFKPGFASLGPAFFEEVFSGNAKQDTEFTTSWNSTLKYRILKQGVVMLPKVENKDRIESFATYGWSSLSTYKNELPLAYGMLASENKFIIRLREQLRQEKRP